MRGLNEISLEIYAARNLLKHSYTKLIKVDQDENLFSAARLFHFSFRIRREILTVILQRFEDVRVIKILVEKPGTTWPEISLETRAAVNALTRVAMTILTVSSPDLQKKAKIRILILTSNTTNSEKIGKPDPGRRKIGILEPDSPIIKF